MAKVDMDKVRDGLKRIREMLAAGEMKHWKEDAITGLNMQRWNCDTAKCIGGWLESWGYMKTYDVCGEALDKLFYPTSFHARDYESITCTMAVQAIDNYLEEGEPLWWTIPNDIELKQVPGSL